MVAFLVFALLTCPATLYDRVSWTTGFSYHHSTQLPSGLIFLEESGFYAEGNLDKVRLSWFRREGSRFRRLQSFESLVTLDDLPVVVHGNRVHIKVVDEMHAFQVAAVDDTFARDITWDVAHDRPRLVHFELLVPRLRAVDAAIWHSWSAKHPTTLQRQLRKAWPEPDELGTWSEKRHGSTRIVTVDHEYVYTLRASSNGWKVVRFGRHPKAL